MSKINYPIKQIKGIAFDIDGVLSPTCVPMGEDGIPRRMANLKDGYAMVLAVKADLKIAIISGAVAPGIKERLTAIGVQDIYCGSLEKLEILKEWMAKYGFERSEVAFVGDDVPDVAPMLYCGLGVAPHDASRDALQAAKYITEADGGHGVARELLEQILRAQDLWPKTDVAYGL